ncbi:NADH-quinone oxidoreductase subunit NuoE [bacterium]|nr:NADH-quinone oxidoreductase subunit NuoE [bacterium]
MGFEFSKKSIDKIKETLLKYPEKEASLLPVLHIAQDEFLYISQDVINLVALTLDIHPSRVKEVATFYTMYNKKPVGKYHIQLCRNISCSLRGSSNIKEQLEKILNIKAGETTSDGKFTLSTVECLGACGTAPVMQINDKYYENLTTDSLKTILDSLS